MPTKPTFAQDFNEMMDKWDEVMACVKACHEAVHAQGAPRITSTIKLGTRTDRTQSMQDKVSSVEAKL
jgi:uncharacterized protein (TIGR00106 family)